MRTLWIGTALALVVGSGCTADFVPFTDAGSQARAVDAMAPPSVDAQSSPTTDAALAARDSGAVDAATSSVDAAQPDLDMTPLSNDAMATLEDRGVDAADAATEVAPDGAADSGTDGMVVADAAADAAAIADAAAGPAECVGPLPRFADIVRDPIPDEQCMNCVGAPIPTWRMADFQPLSCGFEQTYGLDSFTQPAPGGRATLVALFNAGCGYCRGQAEQLDRMRIELRLQGHDAYFVALNGHRYAVHQEGLAARCSFPLLQDTEELGGLDAMDGAIYDMFVYRPDGTLHVFLPGFGGPDTYLSEDEGARSCGPASSRQFQASPTSRLTRPSKSICQMEVCPMQALDRTWYLLALCAALMACSNGVQPSIGGRPALSDAAENTDTTPTTNDAEPGDMPDMDPPGPDLERGQLLYGVYCGFCHGDMGQGYVSDNANALANPNFLASADDDFIRSSIVNGRPGTPMSAWGKEQGGPLDPEDTENVLAYIRGWESDLTVELGPDSEGSAERGAAVYAAACAACHGDEGEGRQGDGGALSLNNPWFLDVATDGFIRYAIVDGRPGTSMGAYGEVLTEQEIEDVVALIRSWQRPTDTAPPGEYIPVLEDIVINEGGMEPDFELREGKYVGVDAVNAAIEAGQAVVMLDARAHGDFLDGHIVGAVSMPFYLLADHIDQFPRDVWIISYCGCPHAISGQAWSAFDEAGFDKIAVLDEGYYEWQNRGYPVTGAR